MGRYTYGMMPKIIQIVMLMRPKRVMLMFVECYTEVNTG